MVVEALSLYLESLAAFWTGMARLGLFRLLIVALILYWIFGRGCRCHPSCPRCGCWCRRCRCREVEGHREGDAGTSPSAEEKAPE